jgi:hypothetical protein
LAVGGSGVSAIVSPWANSTHLTTEQEAASMSNTTEVRVAESEDELITTAQQAVSQSNWVVGECAAKWTKKYAKGRTDSDFGALVGLSGDQVYQRRRVWESFSDVKDQYPPLRWSHFYVALNWDDAPECLAWAVENEATVSEMRAWRRAQRGEDLTAEPIPEDWADDPHVAFVPSEPTAVRDPATFGAAGERGDSKKGTSGERSEAVAGVARGSDGSDYAPFRSTAGSPAPKADESTVITAPKPAPSAEQLLKRMTSTLERINRDLTPELLAQLKRLPEKQRNRFSKSAAEFTSKVAELL